MFARLAALAAAVLSLAAPATARTTASAPSVYTVTPVMDAGALQGLGVSLRFQGDADGVTDVMLPDRWSGAENLHLAISDVRVAGGQLRPQVRSMLRVTHAAGAEVEISYRVRQDFEGAPRAGPERPFRPVTQPDWFTAVGWTVFARVEGRDVEAARFAWGAAPEGWTLASDLDHHDGRAMPTMELMDSVLAGGPRMRLIERPMAGGKVRLAVHGDWSFDPAALTDIIGRVGEASAGFWGDRDEPFFVALTPIASDGGKVQYGVGLGDAFSLWVTPNMEAEGLRHILAHEHQHTWFPDRLGGVRAGAAEPMDYWFSEGFAEFYTLRLLQRAGVTTPQEYADDLNRILRRYALSPARDLPNAQIAVGFWSEPSVADLPYQRGLLLALAWDARLRAATDGRKGLDDVVKRMRDGRGLAPQRFRAAYRALGGGDLGDDYRRYVDGGQRVLLPEDLFGPCAKIETREEPVFEGGFDIAATAASNGLVDGVDPTGPAYAAGLRNGMRIIDREGGAPGDATVEVVYRVQAEGAERTIRYQPAGRRTVAVQQVVLKTDAAASCAATLGGA
ncbi:MAG TPA: hypothetical protein VGB49_07510 [Caulobacteraceae bacterium]